MKPKTKPKEPEDTTTEEVVELLSVDSLPVEPKVDPIDLIDEDCDEEDSDVDMDDDEASESSEDYDDEEEEDEEEDEEINPDHYVLFLLDYVHAQHGISPPHWLREIRRRRKGKLAYSGDTIFTQKTLLRTLAQAPFKKTGMSLLDLPVKHSADHMLLIDWWQRDAAERKKLMQKMQQAADEAKLAASLRKKLSKDELELLRRMAPKLKVK